MKDITLCRGLDCPLKQDCCRWEINTPCSPNCEGQSFFWQTPYKDGACDYFEPMSKALKEKGDGQP